MLREPRSRRGRSRHGRKFRRSRALADCPHALAQGRLAPAGSSAISRCLVRNLETGHTAKCRWLASGPGTSGQTSPRGPLLMSWDETDHIGLLLFLKYIDLRFSCFAVSPEPQGYSTTPSGKPLSRKCLRIPLSSIDARTGCWIGSEHAAKSVLVLDLLVVRRIVVYPRPRTILRPVRSVRPDRRVQLGEFPLKRLILRRSNMSRRNSHTHTGSHMHTGTDTNNCLTELIRIPDRATLRSSSRRRTQASSLGATLGLAGPVAACECSPLAWSSLCSSDPMIRSILCDT